MQIDPKIVEAAQAVGENILHDKREIAARTRRVMKAASECVSDDAALAACEAFFGHRNWAPSDTYKMRAALSAGLDKWAEEE